MSKIDQNLSEILGTEEYVVPAEKPSNNNYRPMVLHQEEQNTSDAIVKADVDFTRSNYYSLLEKGNLALDGILEVARESQHPRAYEVAANMMRNLSDMTEKLMVLQKQKKELETNAASTQQSSSPLNIEKAVVFTGTTEDLLKKIKSANSSQQE